MLKNIFKDIFEISFHPSLFCLELHDHLIILHLPLFLKIINLFTDNHLLFYKYLLLRLTVLKSMIAIVDVYVKMLISFNCSIYNWNLEEEMARGFLFSYRLGILKRADCLPSTFGNASTLDTIQTLYSLKIRWFWPRAFEFD